MSDVLDKEKINTFWQSRTEIADPRLATNYRHDGRLDYDLSLVRSQIKPGSRVLDLGAGTCTMTHELLSDAEQIIAVEKFPGFLEAAADAPNLKKVCCDVVDFKSDEAFDMILLFGVVNFLSADETAKLYQRCVGLLREGGCFIVKHQCGIEDEVVVDKHSDELNAAYHARYPAVRQEQALLESFFEVALVDIYPPSINCWNDTHFYAFVCTLKP